MWNHCINQGGNEQSDTQNQAQRTMGEQAGRRGYVFELVEAVLHGDGEEHDDGAHQQILIFGTETVKWIPQTHQQIVPRAGSASLLPARRRANSRRHPARADPLMVRPAEDA